MVVVSDVREEERFGFEVRVEIGGNRREGRHDSYQSGKG
jgi:hypothetical protein